LNLRPLDPQSSALAKLRHSPFKVWYSTQKPNEYKPFLLKYQK
jgi:hypothetical protein